MPVFKPYRAVMQFGLGSLEKCNLSFYSVKLILLKFYFIQMLFSQRNNIKTGYDLQWTIYNTKVSKHSQLALLCKFLRVIMNYLHDITNEFFLSCCLDNDKPQCHTKGGVIKVPKKCYIHLNGPSNQLNFADFL